MSLRSLGFRDLQYMVAVAEHLSISKAAESCAITQPALSERIKRIESVLGVELFERNKRNLRVTPIGEQLVVKAREMLDELREVEAIISSSKEPLSGPLRLGMIATLGPYLMPHILPPLKRCYPKLELMLHEGLTDSLLASLKAGMLDLVVAAAPLTVGGIKQQFIAHEPFVLAAPKDHELTKKSAIKPSDLNGEDMVLLEEGHCLSGQALDVCPSKRRQNRKRLHAMSLETLRHMVASGAGYTLLPQLAVGKRPPLSKLISYRKLQGRQSIGRDIVVAYRDSFNRKTDVEHFVALVQKALEDIL
jgi:LysR family hydrogen peroxide-inducible transcriptional activator